MAIYTDFFVASETELRAAFPYRIPVADQPIEQDRRNPFTGQMQRIKEWVAAEPYPALPEGISFPSKAEVNAMQRFPFVQWRGVEQVKLAALQSILTGVDLDLSVEELGRPALVASGDENSGLFRLPSVWIGAVAGIEELARVAEQWAGTEECRADKWTTEHAVQVIESLRGLAARSLSESKGMFLWVNV